MKYLLFTIVYFLISIPNALISQNYENVYSKNGINIYKQNTEDSRKFKLSFNVNRNVNNVYKQLKNPENYNEWLGSMVKVDKFRSDNNEAFSYVKVGIDNVFTRDGVILTEFQEIPNTQNKLIKQKLIENHPEAKNNHPPFKKFESSWFLSKLSDNKTQVELYLKGGMENDSDLINSIIDKIITNRLYDIATKIKES